MDRATKSAIAGEFCAADHVDRYAAELGLSST
jgi:hypothetical protein